MSQEIFIKDLERKNYTITKIILKNVSTYLFILQSLVVLRKRKFFKMVFYIHILGCGLEENTCVVSLDSEYLGSGNVDQFDAVVFRIRHFSYNAASIFFNI